MKRYKGYSTPMTRIITTAMEAEVFAGSVDTDPFTVGSLSSGNTDAWGGTPSASSTASTRDFSLIDSGDATSQESRSLFD